MKIVALTIAGVGVLWTGFGLFASWSEAHVFDWSLALICVGLCGLALLILARWPREAAR